MRLWYIGICCIICFSCREIQPFTPPAVINGYQITGNVTTANGIALDSVDIRLYFNFAHYTNSPIDTQRVYVTDPSKTLDISVYDPKNVYIRNLFLGFRPVGIVPRAYWNGLDQYGKPAPSGSYNIRYVIDTAVVKQSAVIIDGHSTATTDAFGNFTITNEHFPVGQIIDRYDSAGAYIATDRILSNVILEFNKFNLHAVYEIELEPNQISTGAFVLR